MKNILISFGGLRMSKKICHSLEIIQRAIPSKARGYVYQYKQENVAFKSDMIKSNRTNSCLNKKRT